ncbi:EAL domain-containing protein [Arsenicitalea aurantiaca]|uniref:EAL domain-containing protein n=1 Tax=Arsenicitalea aurantiaca TaxID=1783274 RepID=A0A433X5K0_9HYPH|nr:EAL domain-containing protein [Arsenicitalea aurantiaca]RUT29355.1 EAL domain-containing protein [Arsenicitalea aurantiaca]
MPLFTPSRKSMPAIDYVSIVKSALKDRRAMVFGTLASALGAGAAAFKTQSPVLYAIAGVFVLVTIFRYLDMTRFKVDDIAPTDVDTAAYWESRATAWGALVAFLYGSWCLASFLVVNDSVAELIAMSTTIAAMVGIATRNFGLDRLLTLQLAIACTLLSAGLLLKGDVYHLILAFMLLPMLVAMRFLAADVRNVLLSAVHGRVEASRLASELDTALDTMHHGLCMLDADGRIAVSNDRAEETFAGFVAGSWTGRPFSALLAAAAARGAIPQDAADELLALVSHGGPGKVILRLPQAQFCEVTVSSRGDRTVLLLEYITDRVRAEERINFMAHYDGLTGLSNRAHFTQRVEADLIARERDPRRSAALLMIVDIDDFKHVNDTLGHLVGDRLLVEVGERLRGALPEDALLARFGGDEFLVYRRVARDFDPCPSTSALIGTFKPGFSIMGEDIAINVSIGAVVSTTRSEDLDALLVKADLALYKAKAEGKAHAQIFHEELDTEYRYRQRLKAELRACVAAKGLSLAYQPLIDLRTRRVVACEALARWHHAELGTIPPSVFIPIAEETGLISDITRWVLETATRDCRTWPDEVSVSVNVSARDFRIGNVADLVHDALANSGLAAHRLEIEVTETALIEQRDAATKVLGLLAREGIGIALDDFGTGYSSLSYLQALPFTKLKIDRSFVADIATNPRSLKLLSNVAQLGKDIDLIVTAEGVETDAQLDLIEANTGIDQIQGYLFGVPLPRGKVAQIITRMGQSARPATRKQKQG